ncbi:hypothetical protein BT67DRAFT_483511, partial [Trichocladium antarcticum]
GAQTVAVRCRGVTVGVPVGHDTNAEDVLQACHGEMERVGNPIDLDTSVLLEPCSQPNLERRIRRYERIRDVVNSWNPDSQNMLIVQSDSPDAGKDLTLAGVPRTDEPPAGFVIALYYSQRPGKWSKRYITLSGSGQMFASKKPNMKPADKDAVSLCHLTDYDLYSPTAAEMRKQLKPPKKYCYAIKSQQRSAIFINLDNYVHFFCTDDPNMAKKFRASVHGWRSWYLANTKLQLFTPVVRPSTGRSSCDRSHRGRPSVDLSLRRSIDSHRYRGEDLSPVTSQQIPPVPPLPTSMLGQDDPSFAANGLLGNMYDRRRQEALRNESAAAQQRNRAPPGPDDGFIDGPNLLNNRAAYAGLENWRPRTSGSDRIATRPGSPESLTWLPEHAELQRRPTVSGLARRPSTAASHAPSRSASVRSRAPPLPHYHQHPGAPPPPPRSRAGMPEPLIDLTPTFVEAPQWNREGRGRGVSAPAGTPLIDLATGPAAAPGALARFLRGEMMPPQKPVRRPEVGGGGGGAHHHLSGNLGGGGGGRGFTLLEQCEMQQLRLRQQQQQLQQQQRRWSQTVMEEDGSGLVRSRTVRSSGSSASGMGLAAYAQSRGRAMGLGEGEREMVSDRLGSAERGGPQLSLSQRGRREY